MQTTPTTPTKAEKLCALLLTLGIPPFSCKSSYSDSNARQNLQGRTHYVDADTLRYFKARILNAKHSPCGLVFWLVESVNSKPTEPKKNKRFVCFDVFGTVLNERDQWHRTSGQAEKALYAFLNSFDEENHTANELAKLAKRKQDESDSIKAAIQSIS